MSTHLITDDPTSHPTTHPAADPARVAATDPANDGTAGPDATVSGPGWAQLSTALSDEAALIADRDDLLVTIAPGAGHGAPACLLTTQAMIEIDGGHLAPVDPATARPDDPADRTRYAPMWGLLVHECAHARHSLWTPPDDAPAAAVAAAELLEESRIEAAQIIARPDDRHWLRASARALILADFPTPPTDSTDPTDPTGLSGAIGTSNPADLAGHTGAAWTRHAAAQAAGLLLARRDGGILTEDETAPVQRAVEAVLGTDTLTRLRAVWQAAHTTGSDDAETMIELGRRWCAALGTDPDTGHDPAGEPAGEETAAADPDRAATLGAAVTDAVTKAVTEAVTKAVGRVAAHVATEPPPAEPAGGARRTVEDAEGKARAIATRTARRVFTTDPTATPAGRTSRVSGTRPPLPAEKVAARRIGRALTTAGIRDRVATRRPSVLPPGRLRMRGALVADAQRAARTMPTAAPFVRTTRTVVAEPPLRLGVACDVSGSMTAYVGPVASAAWILAHATAHSRIPATTATVTFGAHVHAITHPGRLPALVSEFNALDDDERVDTAIDALDGALGLARPGAAARLLVIVSDGHFRPGRRTRGEARTDRLRAAGCGVLWLAPHHSAPFDRVQVLELTDPAAAAQAIARAATAALRAAAR